MGSSDKMLVSLSALLLALISSTSALKAVCTFNGEGSGEVTGDILLIEHETPDGTEIEISGELMNLSPGEHGFHIHEKGDLSDNCKGAGGHYNPFGLNHGAPGAEDSLTTGHAGARAGCCIITELQESSAAKLSI